MAETAINFIFSQEETLLSKDPFVRVIRLFLFAEKITDELFLNQYFQTMIAEQDQPIRVIRHKAAIDRQFLKDPTCITEKVAREVLDILGYTIIDLVRDDLQAKLVVTKKGYDAKLEFTSSNAETQSYDNFNQESSSAASGSESPQEESD